MIVVTVAGKVKPEFRQTFLEHMQELAPVVLAEEGCIKYQQNISAADEHTLFLYEEWQSEAHLLTHLDSPHMKAHLAQARPWFDWVEMKMLNASPLTLPGAEHE